MKLCEFIPSEDTQPTIYSVFHSNKGLKNTVVFLTCTLRLPTNDETSETIVRNVNFLLPYFHEFLRRILFCSLSNNR